MTRQAINLEYIEKNLKIAIETMRDACKQAEYELGKKEETPENRISEVQRAFAWGLANASSGISAALAECSRDRERREE